MTFFDRDGRLYVPDIPYGRIFITGSRTGTILRAGLEMPGLAMFSHG